jgi:hypothetical protein
MYIDAGKRALKERSTRMAEPVAQSLLDHRDGGVFVLDGTDGRLIGALTGTEAQTEQEAGQQKQAFHGIKHGDGTTDGIAIYTGALLPFVDFRFCMCDG